MAIQITKEEFEEKVLNSNGKILVDFWASWCGPCRMLAPIMDEISEEGIMVYKVDVDENHELAKEYGVMSIPCVILFENGKELDKSIGFKTKEEILKQFNI